MSPDREQLRKRYLEAQLRDELGEPVDLSEKVLRAVYSAPARRMHLPLPPRRRAWRPLAAAAAVLIAAGMAAYWLVQVLPQHVREGDRFETTASKPPVGHPPATPNTGKPTEGTEPADTPPKQVTDDHEREPQSAEPLPDPVRPNLPADPTAEPQDPGTPGDKVTTTEPDRTGPETSDNKGIVTEPDDTEPAPALPDLPPVGGTGAAERAILVAAWKGDNVRLGERKLKIGNDHQIRVGDRLHVRGFADFTLMDGSLLRVEGEVSFEGEPADVELKLHGGAVYCDTTAPVRISGHELTAVILGVAVVEVRLRALDVYCLSGQVSAAEHALTAGNQARLSADGFGREKPIQWVDVQREFRFLRETPQRTALREELSEAPGELLAGELIDGVLKGEADNNTGLGFYLRGPYKVAAGDVVRFRFKVHKPCELILQFGTFGDGNWRHKLGGVKAGEWIEFELPLMQLYKTADVSQRAQPGLGLKFFQLHPEGAPTFIEIDWVEIVHRP